MSLVVSGANRHDSAKLAELLDAKVIEAPNEQPENLCLDAGYVGKQETVEAAGYIAHIRPRGEEIEEKAKNPAFKPRRWVVEASHSWFNRFRKLAPRYEKTARSYLGLVMLAAAMVVYNKIMIIYG